PFANDHQEKQLFLVQPLHAQYDLLFVLLLSIIFLLAIAMDNQVDHFFLHQSNNLGLILVFQPFTSDNLNSWCLAMCMALEEKKKLDLLMLNSISKEISASVIYSSLIQTSKNLSIEEKKSSIVNKHCTNNWVNTVHSILTIVVVFNLCLATYKLEDKSPNGSLPSINRVFPSLFLNIRNKESFSPIMFPLVFWLCDMCKTIQHPIPRESGRISLYVHIAAFLVTSSINALSYIVIHLITRRINPPNRLAKTILLLPPYITCI
ncbi:hypothetical protein CR513_46213, partial [Mucuna pruriens]